MKKDILILGANGHLGSYLSSPDTTDYIGNIDTLTEGYLAELKPKVIVNCAAKTDMVWAETHHSDCIYNNCQAPAQLYSRVVKVLKDKCLFIQISSGCIWDGPFQANGRPFDSYAPVNPLCVYTESKVECERQLYQEWKDSGTVTPYHILRPRLIFSDKDTPRNLLVKLMQYENLINDYNSFTSCDTIKKAVDWLSKTFVNWHTASSGPYCGIARVINLYDIGISTPFNIAYKLHLAGLRNEPKLLKKEDLDGWHKPKRVNVVLHDHNCEDLFHPNYLEVNLDKCISALANRRNGNVSKV